MNTFYSVLWNGVIIRYDLSITNSNWYRYTSLMIPNEQDDWQIDIDKPTSLLGRVNLSPNHLKKHFEQGDYLISLDDAIKKSRDLWDKHFAPDAKWQVVEIFDDVVIKPISKPLSKIEAKNELRKHKNRPYVSYEIRVVKEE